ncbi:uncharacterized protein [Parasteatoda tepidariorum]|uniref:uncharacterized protein n=1 Tax=Parasteatoda tepidariorum TaxID=114398 RepID=UPI001C728A02|nr:uncharacterized protein LOC107455890 [Parasteatoda tepidariorum]
MNMFRKQDFMTEWMDEPIPMYDFINNFSLPQVVKIHEGENKKFQNPGNFNLVKPILLFKVYTCRKIHGRAVTVNEKGEVIPSGPSLIIPDTYPGWMSLVMKDGKTAGYFSSIGDVSRSSWSLFLVQDQVIGLKSTPEGLQRAIVYSGVVLKAVGSFEDQNRQSLIKDYKGYIHPDLMMYLKCLTQKGEIIFLPYSARGRFYCISTPEAHTINHVYLLSNLLRVTTLPALVRIIVGPKASVALPLTNILQLDEIRRETIILGCTMIDNEPTLLEINASSEFSFIRVKNEAAVQMSEAYQRMCHMCVTEGDKWRQQIRVAHYVVPKKEPFKMISKLPFMPPGFIPYGSNRLRSNKEQKQILPECDFIDFCRQSGRESIFPKRFWMFRRSRRYEPSKRSERSHRTNFDVIRGYYTKGKSGRSMILNLPYRSSLRIIKDTKKDSLRRTSSDDGYATSFMEDESIYNSIY